MHLLSLFSSKVLTSGAAFSMRAHLSTVQVPGTSRGGFSETLHRLAGSWSQEHAVIACDHCRPVSNAASAER